MVNNKIHSINKKAIDSIILYAEENINEYCEFSDDIVSNMNNRIGKIVDSNIILDNPIQYFIAEGEEICLSSYLMIHATNNRNYQIFIPRKTSEVEDDINNLISSAINNDQQFLNLYKLIERINKI